MSVGCVTYKQSNSIGVDVGSSKTIDCDNDATTMYKNDSICAGNRSDMLVLFMSAP